MKKRTVIATLVILLISIAVLTIGYVTNNNAKISYGVALESYYQQNFYDLLENVNDIELNLSKGLISTSNKVKEDSFQKIYQLCAMTQITLSKLPINHQSVYETTRLVNQLGGYSYYILQKIKNVETLIPNDITQLNTLYDMTLNVQKALNEYHKSINYDFSFLLNSLDKEETNTFENTFASLQSEQSGIEFPTLIYDGPFSDSVINKDIKGLDNVEKTKEECEIIINEKIGSIITIESIKYDTETNGRFVTFDFIIKRNDLPDMYVQVTKKGGMILTISSVTSVGEEQKTLTECEEIAENFASKLGFSSLKSVWGTIIKNIAYINLTTVTNDVIIYPEMIKVKINITNGDCVGWEAQNYAINHETRSDLTPTVTANSARAVIDNRLTVLTQKLTLVPQDYDVDVLCYEFKCTFNEYTYYVYVNAKTNIEQNILRIIETDKGELIQ